MAVRNFWVEADIDGRQTTLAGGPRRRDGGMDVILYQRDKGGIKEVATITCRELDGHLFTEIQTMDGRIHPLAMTAR